MAHPLRVGIIGASAQGGWAGVSHVPAVQGLAGLELAAVATNSQATADAAASKFGVRAAYGNAADLFRDPNIDIVSVVVKAPDHRPLVLGALAAGKHVYCEWPLGTDVAESEEMAAAADKAGVHVAIGLQTRTTPAARFARELIAAGKIGRLLSARSYSSTATSGGTVPLSGIYTEEPKSGVNLVAIQGAHTIDFAIAVVGALTDMATLGTVQYPEVEVLGGDGKPFKRINYDYMLLQSRLAAGGALSIEVAGGRPEGTPFRLEAIGVDGTVVVEGGALRGFQAGRLRVSLNGVVQALDEDETKSMSDEAANVASMYISLRDDILHGTRTAPDFDHAVRLTRLIADAFASSRTDTIMKPTDWPVQ